MKSPALRAGVQNSGGTPLTCDGLFTPDWNAVRAANPGSLGQPLATGEKVFVQAWYRDLLTRPSSVIDDAASCLGNERDPTRATQPNLRPCGANRRHL